MNPTPTRHRMRPIATLLALGCVWWLGGCRQAGDAADASPPRPEGPELAISHVLVAFDGVHDEPTGLARTREEASERARRIAVLLRTGRGDLAAMARRYSDDPTAQRNGGYLGVFYQGDMEPALEAAVCSLEVGEIGGPIETAHGFHVVRREPLRRLNIHHLLIAHRDAVRADRGVDRDRTDAARVAQALQRKISGGEVDLCELAERFSDDCQNRERCGDLGWVEPGMLAPTAEQAVFSLGPGEVSSVVESEFGFHIFWRD